VEQNTLWPWLQRNRRVLAFASILLAAVFAYPAYAYVKYYRLVSDNLRRGPFADATSIYSAPEDITAGERLTPAGLVARLRLSGYSTDPANPNGSYIVKAGSIEVHPGPQSYFRSIPAIIRFNNDSVSGLTTTDGRTRLEKYQIEPELITNIVDGAREKRRIVRYDEIPKVLVQAITSAEDKRFFEHMGLDPFRVAKAAYIDLRSKRKEQGASTITMQLARNLWLDPDKTWRRKARELLITLILEQKLSKGEIFEFYVNQVYLGRYETYSVNGFGEASQVYFGKDISQLNLPEAATLAGLIQRPSYFNPFRYPERSTARRNRVLDLMRQNRYISEAQYAAVLNTPLKLSPPRPGEGDAPYFVALLNDELQSRLPDEESGGYNVYSSLDPDLQKAAMDAVRDGIAKVDKLVRRRNKDGVLPQVALVALDPHTGEVKALVGGRNYSSSQLNHAISMRQPGSAFKPFVYAAALNTGIESGDRAFTEASTLNDTPTTFLFGNQVYEPGNFEDEFMGTVTLKKAMAHSLNVATVSLAEEVGYQKVVALAKRAGFDDNIEPTPAVALGAYEASPLEVAGAYTTFANNGEYVKPTFVREVRTTDGRLVVHGSPDHHRALDPRVAFLMRDMLQEVLRSGTGAGVRAQGFKVPAAGKTGTSRDGWFAGFTSDLLCVVWVGFDDNRELKLEGARSALPIWTGFMKRAVAIRKVAHDFGPPPGGVVRVAIDPDSGLRGAPDCPGVPEYFIAGTEPTDVCQPQPPDLSQVAPLSQTIRTTAATVGNVFSGILKGPAKLFK
jgi:penicillin-binding protein 1B